MTSPKKKLGPMQSMFIRDIPKNLMRAFAAKCALLGITQKQKVMSLIREWVQQLDSGGKEEGK